MIEQSHTIKRINGSSHRMEGWDNEKIQGNSTFKVILNEWIKESFCQVAQTRRPILSNELRFEARCREEKAVSTVTDKRGHEWEKEKVNRE